MKQHAKTRYNFRGPVPKTAATKKKPLILQTKFLSLYSAFFDIHVKPSRIIGFPLISSCIMWSLILEAQPAPGLRCSRCGTEFCLTPTTALLMTEGRESNTFWPERIYLLPSQTLMKSGLTVDGSNTCEGFFLVGSGPWRKIKIKKRITVSLGS